MFVLSSIFFACLGLAAIAAITANIRRYLPLIGELRRSLVQSPATFELRHRVEDLAMVSLRATPRPFRHFHRPKPIRHRLHGANLRRAIA